VPLRLAGWEELRMPKKLDSCVKKVKGRVNNPYAVCTASIKGKRKRKQRGKKK
jgi:hypothetical protein